MKNIIFTAACILAHSLFFAPTQAQEPQTPSQTVRGVVVNAATQQPIAGATVRLPEIVNVTKDGKSSVKGAVTRPDGTFKIAAVPAGRTMLRVTALGYEPASMPIVVTSGKELVLTLTLAERIIKTEEVSVSGSRGGFVAINESALVSSNVFTLDDAYRFAGARGDVSRMASAFAGVISANDQRNDIIIRGGSPTELLWRIDGLDVPNPNHFATQGATGGPVGAINSNVLANSDFLTGAFPAEYGDRMSGVFDLRTRKGNNEKYEFAAQFGFNGIEAMAEGPLPALAPSADTSADSTTSTPNNAPASNRSSFLVSYRKSFLEILSALGVDFGAGGVPRYEDLSLKLDLNAGEHNKIWITGLFGTSDIDMRESKLATVRTGYSDTRNGTDVGALGVNWRHFFSDRTFGTLMLGGVANRYRTDVDSLTANADFKPIASTPWYRNRALEGYGTLKYSLSHSPDAQNVFTGAIETRLRFYNLDEYRTTVSRTSRTATPFAVRTDGTALHVLSYVNWNHRFSDELTINLGLHSQYLGISNRATLEPRAALSWNFAPTQTFTFGTGLYRQSHPLALYFDTTGQAAGQASGQAAAQAPNRTLDFSQALHVVLGYANQFAPDMLAKVEVYYKDYAQIPVQASTSSSFSMMNAGANFGSISGVGALANTGRGRSYGAELSYTKHFESGWYAQSALSLVRQEFVGSDGVWRNGAFDNLFVLNVLAGYEWKLTSDFTIEFSGRYARAGGSPRTPIDLAQSRFAQATVRDASRAFGERNPDYERIDARIDLRQNFNGWALISYFSMENLLDRRNVLSQSYSVSRDRAEDVTQIGRFFVGGFRIEF
jgi:hypothetical protein